jgi:hypothetical protein
MRKRTNLNRILTLAGFAAAGLLTTACGGGSGSASAVPTAKPPVSSSGQKMAQGRVTAVIPAATTPQGHRRTPKYLNTSDPNSAITVSVTPSDPAEAAQWSTLYGTTGFTICFNLYTAGVVNAALNPVAVPGGVQVSFPMPTPPGNDVFLITQYDGQCSATNPYAAPVPNPNANGNGVLSQAPPITVNINPGVNNNFNVQLTVCPQAPTPTTCSNVPPPGGTPPTPVVLGAAVASVYLAGSSPAPKSLAAPIPIPIQQPIREQAQFLAAGSHIGVPVPVVGLDSAGFVIAGSPIAGSGTLPKAGDKITLSHTEAGPGGAVTGHAKLYLIDATTGAVAQTEAPGTPITLTMLNALDPADAVSGGTVGDPYVVVLSTDGSNAKGFLSSTVTLKATLNGNTIPDQMTTFAEQGAIYTDSYGPPGSGFADAAGPISGADQIVNTIGSGLPAAAQGLWVVNGASMSEVGVGRFPVVGGALSLHGAAFDANPSVNAIFVADISATLGSLQTAPASNATASGLYMFNPVTHESFPVAVQFQQSNSYIGFQNPQAVAYIPGGYLYVEESNRIWAIDPQSNGAGTGLTTVTNGGTTYIQAEAIGQVPVSGIDGSAALGLSFIGIAPNTLLFADPGTQRIASINASTGAVTSLATGARFAGLSPGPSAGTYYACSLEGQLYSIASGTATSFGLPLGTFVDGPVGVGATLSFATPSSYAVQGTTANFFGSASAPTLPYTVAPFAAAGPIFAAAAQAAVAGGVLKFAPDTSAQSIGAGAAQSGLIDECSSVVYVTAAMAGANPALTPESFLFSDRGVLRTLVP